MLVRLRSSRGTSASHYRCSVPGLAGFAAARLHGVRSLIICFFWRRGWDSNPRYGFPYTAFPVLPVKPLLHLSRRKQKEKGKRTLLHFCLFPFDSYLTCLTWRRGWDSNPRYPCGYNGFRDRPIQPLSHLSTLVSPSRLRRKKDCNTRRHSASRRPPSTVTR